MAGVSRIKGGNVHEYLIGRADEWRRRSRRAIVERTGARVDGDPAQELAAFVAESAQSHLAEFKDSVNSSNAPSLEGEGLRWTSDQLRSHYVERLRETVDDFVAANRALVPVLIPVLWNQIVSPPYDVEWAEGSGLAFGAKVDGKVFTLPNADGFSAAGVGFHITSPVAASATLTPIGDYKWNWWSPTNLPTARSRGGLGTAVFRAGESTPVVSRQPILWTVAGATAMSGQGGEGRIADAASPAFGLGTVPLAPVQFEMAAGADYLVWFWCWQTSQVPPEFWAILTFTLQFVTVLLDDPFVGPH
jgi:hypothetical protein